MKICEHGAYSKIDKRKQEAQRQKKKTFQNFLINNLLLISGVVMALSGLSQQLGFHMGEHVEQEVRGQEELLQTIQYEQIRNIDTNKIVWGFNYSDWSTIHKYAIVFFSLFMIYHIYVHWRLYTGVLSKHLLNKNIQVITLSVLFIFVAVTGLVPWVIDLSGGKSILRLLFIEIHDKIALVFIIYLILHLIKRNKWFVSSYARLIKEKP
jgi:magnesium-transporting ATPase (P-type)